MSKLSPFLALLLFVATASTAMAILPTLECDNSNPGVVLCHVNDIGNSVDFVWKKSGGINLHSAYHNVASFTCGMGGASGSVQVNFRDPDANITYIFGRGVECLPCGPFGAR